MYMYVIFTIKINEIKPRLVCFIPWWMDCIVHICTWWKCTLHCWLLVLNHNKATTPYSRVHGMRLVNGWTARFLQQTMTWIEWPTNFRLFTEDQTLYYLYTVTEAGITLFNNHLTEYYSYSVWNSTGPKKCHGSEAECKISKQWHFHLQKSDTCIS